MPTPAARPGDGALRHVTEHDAPPGKPLRTAHGSRGWVTRLGGCRQKSGLRSRDAGPSNLNRLIPAEGRPGSRPQRPSSFRRSPRRSACSRPSPRCSARPRLRRRRSPGQARTRHLHLRELHLGNGVPAPRSSGELEEVLQLRVRFVGAGDGAALLAGPLEIRHRWPANASCSASTPTSPPSPPACSRRTARTSNCRRLGRPGLPALRLGLLRLRLRRREDDRPARELRGTFWIAFRQLHRDPRSARSSTPARPALGVKDTLRRPRAAISEGLHPHRHRLVRSLRPVHQRRGRHGARLRPPRPPTA